MKKYNFFAQNRLVFLAREKAEAAIAEEQTEATERVGGIEAALKSGKNFVQATEAAKFFVREAGRNAREKLDKDWELRKDQKEYLAYQQKVKDVAQKALDEIEKNSQRYEAIADFIAKKTETTDTLKRNRDMFENEIKGSHDLHALEPLQNTIDGLSASEVEINEMEAPDMEKDKAALIKEIEDQIKDFLEETITTRKFHMEQLNAASAMLHEVYDDLAISRVEDEGYKTEAGKEAPKPLKYNDGREVQQVTIPSGIPRLISDARVRQAWQHLIYIKEMQAILGGLQEEELQKLADEASNEAHWVEPLLKWWDQKHNRDRGTPADDRRKRAWDSLPALEANLARARAKAEELENKRNASSREKFEARQWVAGALENVNKQLNIARNGIMETQMEHEELEYADAPPVASIRLGTTQVEHKGGPAPAEEEEETKTPEPIARAEEKKRGRKA
jgi:hypothetical protein